MDMSPDFLDAYDIPVLAGRGFDRNIANDSPTEGVETQNALINELALEALQIASASDAINKRFYLLNDDGPNTEFVIVGVLPTQNIIGLFNQEKPVSARVDADRFNSHKRRQHHGHGRAD
jgi:putative ABC transport system permease protein